MKTIKGPAIFLAQFMGDEVPFDNLAHLAGWAAGLGFKGIQVPCDARLIDLEQAAASQTYCDELRETADRRGRGDHRVVDASARATGRRASGL